LANLPELACRADLLIYDADFCQLWPERAPWHTPKEMESSKRACEQPLNIAKHYANVVEELLALQQTFTHGEFVGSNVLVRSTAAGKEICPIDWEMAPL
jgi:hypothetical protein